MDLRRMATAELRSLLAFPGDEDLDIEVEDVRVVAIVRHDESDVAEVVIGIDGGRGRWVSDGEPHEGLEEANGTLCLTRKLGTPRRTAMHEAFIEQLERWRERATPLKLTGAPGRSFMLSDAESEAVALGARR